MGCFDFYCPFCGLPTRLDLLNISYLDFSLSEREIKKLEKKYNLPKIFDNIHKHAEWLGKATLLLPNGEIKHNLEEVSCNNNFGNVAYGYPLFSVLSIKSHKFGIFLHTHCYKYVSELIKKNLEFNDIPYLQINEFGMFDKIKYVTTPFLGQSFNAPKMLLKDINYFISPLHEKSTNRKQIKSVISKAHILKFLKNKDTPEPPYPASILPEKSYGVGDNDNIWQVVKGKWVNKNTATVRITFNIKKHRMAFFPFFIHEIITPKFSKEGYSSSIILKPLFIYKYKFEGNNVTVELLTTQANKVEEMFKKNKISHKFNVVNFS